MEHTNNGRNFMDRIQVWFDTVISSVRRCHSFKSIEKLIGPTVEKSLVKMIVVLLILPENPSIFRHGVPKSLDRLTM